MDTSNDLQEAGQSDYDDDSTDSDEPSVSLGN